MIAGIVIGCYVAGFVIAARVYVMTSDEDHDEARLNGTLMGLVWPLVLVFAAVLGLLSLPTLGAKTGQERRLRARQAAETAEKERAKLQRRVAELEREAGIGP